MAEQQERRNVGEKEGGQPSKNSGETGPEPKEHRIDIVEINPTVKKWNRLVQEARERIQPQSQLPMIPKVPQILRQTQDFEKLYEPRVISLGPYHHGKPHLHPVEMIKPLCAEQFLAHSNQDIKDLYTKIESKIEAVRDCYDSNSTKEYNDEALAWMMLLDGCFLLQFISSRVNMSNGLRNHQINFVKQDLFLLENQLPFGVLKLISEEAKFDDGLTLEEMIKKFVTDIGMPEGLSSEIQLKEENEEPSHLLDLLRSALLGRFKMIRGSQPEQEQEAEKKGESSSSSGGGNGASLPEQEQEAEKKGKSSSSSGGGNGGSQPEQEQEAEKKGKSSLSGGDGEQRGIWKSFRHIKELKAAGIYLKPRRASFLTDISFESHFFYGCLKLPPITIDGFTKTKFLNMVAYEMCPDAPVDQAVTSYVCFLYELIDQADDVKELRSKHILHNLLGSDEDVAKIFNEIGNDLVDPGAYGDVKARIQKHYDKRVKTWIAEGLHEHFRSPWTFTALIAAVWILIVTGLQTYYAHPGKQMMHIYMGLLGVPIFLFLVWYIVWHIVWLLWD
ncbi:hypothetical protein VitviT2T_020988 [Vitis vinifera]|uniref:Uncharacterized protein n=1 Tax=Vitis vinifera TaxID=29760 RepID=A0ABY9D7Q7_VITVI|nr:UPF0481 protein At3g47200-like [Vitis vinifera]WKA02835.1 hypothetical protein VitviT2T_020988 [Vitis vinifera]|eukprot:XP_010659791.1 PREDICTED: UPF0481 protein At3g47200-like [Vitis vinifera]